MNYFVNHSEDPWPPLVLFKAGTGNDFATTLYGNASNEDIAMIALRASPQPVDLGVCNGRRYINMAGIGFDGQAMKNQQMIRWMGKFWGYYYAILRTILEFRESCYEIALNGGQFHEGRYLLIHVANSPTTGGGFKVSPRALINDGKLNVMLCQPLTVLKRLRKLPLIRKGKHLSEPYITHQEISSAIVKAKKPVPAQLDGELVVADRFDFRILPGALQFLYIPRQAT
jgi:diacylglycerol kinase family enzyme